MTGHIGIHLSVVAITNIGNYLAIQDCSVCFHLNGTYFAIFDKGVGDDLQCKHGIRVFLFQCRPLVSSCFQQFPNTRNPAQGCCLSLSEEFSIGHLYCIACLSVHNISPFQTHWVVLYHEKKQEQDLTFPGYVYLRKYIFSY